MQKGFRLIITIILSLLLVSGTMAGCTKNNSSGTTSNTASITTSVNNATASSSGNSTSIIDNSKLTKLTVYSEMDPATAQSCKDLNDHEVFKELEKRTGVHVNWIHPTAGAGEEQFNLLIASGDFPDLIKYDWPNAKGGVTKYAQDKVIIKLNDLIDNYAKDFVKLLNEYPSIKRNMTNADGEMYFFPQVIITPENNIYKGPIIRQDWLDKLSLSVPTNINELYTVLKAFKTGIPEVNGKAVWPMSGACYSDGGFYSSSAHSIGFLTWAWDTNVGCYLRDGKIQFGPMDPQFEQALRFANKLYNEKLLDPDYLLNDRTKLDAKIMSNQVGFVFHYQPTKFMTAMATVDPGFKVAGIPYLKGPDGQKGVFDGSLITNIVNAGCVAITTACEYPEEAMKWLNYGYTEEGNLLMNFGIEDKSYTMVDGNPVYTDLIRKNPDGLAMNIALGKWSMAVCKWPATQDVRYFQQYVVTDYSRDSINAWKSSIDFDPFSRIVPVLVMNPEDSEKYASIFNDIETYIFEMCDKFVLGKESFDNYGKFIERLKAMKVEEAVALQQKAYEAYIKK